MRGRDGAGDSFASSNLRTSASEASSRIRPTVTVLALLLALAPAAPGQQPPPPPPPEPGFLGVAMAPWPVPGSEPPSACVRVTGLVPGSAAEKAGLREGDVIVSLDGQPIAAAPGEVLTRFSQTVRSRGPGAEVKLVVRRRTLEVRTLRGDEPQGPPVETTGSQARTALPDLGKLAEEHLGELVSVRARLSDRESEVVATLGKRPGESAEPLPANATLRPDLEALPLAPEAALAARLVARTALDGSPLQARLDGARAALEKDELVRDPFRLATVRYLKRDPLRLPGVTRRLAADLGEALEREPLSLEAARPLLDAAPPAPRGAQTPPDPGAEPAAHAAYIASCVAAAAGHVERAFAALGETERAQLAEALPSLAEQFGRGIYLHEDEDQARWARHRAAIDLLPKVDRSALLDALDALLPLAAPDYLQQLEQDLRAAEARGASAWPGPDVQFRGRCLWDGTIGGRRIIFGGSGPNEWRLDPDVIVDLGGDDRYHVPAGGARPGRPVAVCLDLGGDDRHQATQPFAQGAALLGAALLVDRAGDDRYTSSAPFAQGAALCGAALLLDQAGADDYRAPAYAQGAALCQGLGALVDRGGGDTHHVGLHGQGFAGPGAAGLLLARGGDDRYVATGAVPCTYGDPGTFHAMSQGASCGFRQLASGGIAVLLDRGGADRYEAGNFSQGGGYYFGWGALLDLGAGPDRYEGSRYAQGFAAHSALGSLLDEGGDDVYRGWVGAQVAAAWDLCATAFLDDAGDDVYETGAGFSVGAAAHNGVALFCDGGGRDRYRVEPGKAGPNDYHGGPSLSLFLDAGGEPDRYEGGGLADGRLAVAADAALSVDLPVPLEAATDEVLDRLPR